MASNAFRAKEDKGNFSVGNGEKVERNVRVEISPGPDEVVYVESAFALAAASVTDAGGNVDNVTLKGFAQVTEQITDPSGNTVRIRPVDSGSQQSLTPYAGETQTASFSTAIGRYVHGGETFVCETLVLGEEVNQDTTFSLDYGIKAAVRARRVV